MVHLSFVENVDFDSKVGKFVAFRDAAVRDDSKIGTCVLASLIFVVVSSLLREIFNTAITLYTAALVLEVATLIWSLVLAKLSHMSLQAKPC